MPHPRSQEDVPLVYPWLLVLFEHTDNKVFRISQFKRALLKRMGFFPDMLPKAPVCASWVYKLDSSYIAKHPTFQTLYTHLCCDLTIRCCRYKCMHQTRWTKTYSIHSSHWGCSPGCTQTKMVTRNDIFSLNAYNVNQYNKYPLHAIDRQHQLQKWVGNVLLCNHEDI